ncbi:four helix bundle protein [bacterium]|nr:MAG: four helix bundle protein [bacterium]
MVGVVGMVGPEEEEEVFEHGSFHMVAEGRSTYRPIEDLDVYKDACDLADAVVMLCYGWPHFHRDTLGKQLARSVDSIGANLVEGDGRLSPADSLRFIDYARASARETQHWLTRASKRGLIEAETAEDLNHRCEHISRRITKVIQYRRSRI